MSEERSGLGVTLAQAVVPAALLGAAIAAVEVAGFIARGGAPLEHVLRCCLADLVVGVVAAPAAAGERLLRGHAPRVQAVGAVVVLAVTAGALLLAEASLGYAYGLGAAADDGGAAAVQRNLRWFATMPGHLAALLIALSLPSPALAVLRACGARLRVQVAACGAVSAGLSLPLLAAAWDRLSGMFVVSGLALAPQLVACSAALPLLFRLADAVERRAARWARGEA